MKKALIVSCFDWYELRLKYVEQVLIATGYDVEILLSDFNHIEKKYLVKSYKNTRYLHTLSYHRNMSVLIPPNLLAYVCSKYKQKNQFVKLYYDIIDMWPESISNEKLKKIFAYDWWKKIRDKSLPVADFVFTECELYQMKLSYVLNKQNSMTQHLCMPQVAENNIISYLLDTLKLCYLGSVNSLIDIDLIIKIIEKLRQNQMTGMEVHIIGDGEKRKDFLAPEKLGMGTIWFKNSDGLYL